MKRKLNLALWIVAGILAVVFLVSSSTKLFVPKQKLASMGGTASRWVDDFSPSALKAIGALEFLAAAGLIVPAALGIAPILVRWLLPVRCCCLWARRSRACAVARGQRSSLIWSISPWPPSWRGAASARSPSPGREACLGQGDRTRMRTWQASVLGHRLAWETSRSGSQGVAEYGRRLQRIGQQCDQRLELHVGRGGDFLV